MQRKRFFFILLLVTLLLLVPLFAQQFTDEVNWTLFDFILAGVMLLSTGLFCDFIFRKVKTNKYSIAIIVAIFGMLLLIWAELAVGIFGTPLSGL